MMTSAHPVRAVLLFNLGLVLFACMDVTNKYLAAQFDVPLIAACRYIGNILLMLAFVAPKQGLKMVQTQRTGLVWFRAACLAMQVMATGGVFVGGGIAPKNIDKFRDGTFMEAFVDKGHLFRPILQKVPVHVVLEQRTALIGAAQFALAHV